MRFAAGTLTLVTLAACAGAAARGAQTPADAGNSDAGDSDAGNPEGSDLDAGNSDAGNSDAGLPLGEPIAAPAGQWTWIDFPDSSCDDGSPTGIAVNPSPSGSSNVLVYLEGGGACWDATTCFVLNTSVHGPFGQTEFDALKGNFVGTIADRAEASNPVRDWNLVFIPYCTGDVHLGANVMTYVVAGQSRPFHHVGHSNVLTYLQRIAATFPAPGRAVVSGSSAGGGGALGNYADFRARWPDAKMALLDDSLPFFEGAAIPEAERDAWNTSWNLAPLLTPLCGPACISDLSQLHAAVAARYQADRMALLSSTNDAVISSYYAITGAQFEIDLLALTTDVLSKNANSGWFYVAGATHTMLGDPSAFTSETTQLWTWLTRLVTDDPAWQSVMP